MGNIEVAAGSISLSGRVLGRENSSGISGGDRRYQEINRFTSVTFRGFLSHHSSSSSASSALILIQDGWRHQEPHHLCLCCFGRMHTHSSHTHRPQGMVTLTQNVSLFFLFSLTFPKAYSHHFREGRVHQCRQMHTRQTSPHPRRFTPNRSRCHQPLR